MTRSLLAALALCCAAPAAGAWEAPQPLTNTGSDLWFAGYSASGGTVHFVRGDGGHVVYKRSLDEGVTWSTNVVIGNGTTYLDEPLKATDGSVYVLYVNNMRTMTDFFGSRSVGDIYVRVSKDDGSTWKPEIRLTTARSALRVSVGASGPNVNVSWMDYRSGIWSIYDRRSNDGGLTWQPEVLLVKGTNKVGAGRPSVAVSGDTVLLSWMDARANKPPCTIEGGSQLPVCTDTYTKRSTDGGATWGPDTMLSDGVNYGGRPSAAMDGQNAFVSFDTNGGGYTSESGAVSNDGGASFKLLGVLSGGIAGDSTHSSAIVAGDLMGLAWFVDSSRPKVYFRESPDDGQSWQATQRIDTSGNANTPFLAATDNYLQAMWGDYASGRRQFWRSRQAR